MALSREELEAKLKPWQKGSTGSESPLDPKILDRILEGTHGSFTPEGEVREGASIHFNVDQGGSDIVPPISRDEIKDTDDDTRNMPRPSRTRTDTRSEMLLPERTQQVDYTAQARQQVSPQFDRMRTQLEQGIEQTRGQIPRRLLTRGQSVGGQRTLQEGELDRNLAYGLSDLQAQEQMAVQQQAQALRQQQQAQQQQQFENQLALRAQQLQAQGMQADQAYRQAQLEMQQQGMQFDQNRWQQEFGYGQTQDQIDNLLRQRQLQLQEQGMSFDQAMSQAQLELQQNQLDENVRQFNANQDYKYWYGGQQFGGSGGAGGTSGTGDVDISDYTSIMDYLYEVNPSKIPAYINNLRSQNTSQDVISALQRRYGVSTSGVTNRPSGNLDIQDRSTGIVDPTPTQIEDEPTEDEIETGNLKFSEIDSTADNLLSRYANINDDGEVVGYNVQQIINTLNAYVAQGSMNAMDVNAILQIIDPVISQYE